jgi:hypothetical protein
MAAAFRRSSLRPLALAGRGRQGRCPPSIRPGRLGSPAPDRGARGSIGLATARRIAVAAPRTMASRHHGAPPLDRQRGRGTEKLTTDSALSEAWPKAPDIDLLSGAQQPMPDDEQIGEIAAHPQTVRVLRQPAIAHLGKAKHALDDQKRLLEFGAHLGFSAVLAALHFIVTLSGSRQC